jgi:5'-3' exonuclease
LINNKPLDYGDALLSLRPGASWVVENGDLDNINWMSDQPQPTKEEIEQELERLFLSQQQVIIDKDLAIQSALEKLSKLGLTEEEAKAIVGI